MARQAYVFVAISQSLIGSNQQLVSSQSSSLLSLTLRSVRALRSFLFRHSHLAKSLSPEVGARWDLTLLGGLLGSLFSLCQYLVSPRLGALSDKYGRRPVLLASMFGNLLSAVLWLFAGSFGVYAASRLVGGLSEGNVQLSIAAISDVTPAATRSKSLALVGVAFSLAFTLGPSLGAYFAQKTLGTASRVTIAGRELRLNSYAVPAAVTLVLLAVETVYLAACLPETRWDRAEEDGETRDEKRVARRTVAQRRERLRRLEAIHRWFLFFFSVSSRDFQSMRASDVGADCMQRADIDLHVRDRAPSSRSRSSRSVCSTIQTP